MAYASLVSLVNILRENIELHLIPENSPYIQTLLQEAGFFQNFLQKSSNKSSQIEKYLESRIRDAAFKAQDIIDSHVAHLFDESAICLASLFKDLDEVMVEINSIKLEAMQIGENDEDNNDEPAIQPSICAPAGSSRPSSRGMTTMIGLDDRFKEIKTQLMSGSSQREIVAIVGMGGIGKTTLAQKVYNEKSISSRFDIRGWATVSQEHNVQTILLGLLDSIGELTNALRLEQKEKLAEVLYKRLKHKRYFIVLDDMWDTRVWDYLKRILADDENGSRILLTTRLKKVAEYDNNCPPHDVRFLNAEESWNLFCEKVFGHDCCPLELEKVGKEIVRNCRGLPLAINVIGGHLSKAKRTPQYWRSVAKNLSETIASEDDDQCSRVLSLSYKHLPHHLKGCFLYMSIFPEDYVIEVSILVHLWIASGLIKEERSKSFEDVAEDYFLDFVERNLILVSNHKYNGRIMRCKIHDLVRDLCVKEATAEKFFHLNDKTFYEGVDVSPRSRLLRALCLKRVELRKTNLLPTMENQLTNMRFLYYPRERIVQNITLSRQKFMHLHTIYAAGCYSTLDIWEMPQLRHVKIASLSVPNPPATKTVGENSAIVPGKLQTLSLVRDPIFTDEVFQRIQNIKKLGVTFVGGNSRDLGLNNLERLRKLESLRCCFFYVHGVVSIHDMSFPHSIKKLSLRGSKLPWKDMTVVGSLANLQVLKLISDAFIGEEWEMNEGEFLNLKTLHLERLDLVHWTADADHFPELQHLFITQCRGLKGIPSGFGGIPTLQLIRLQMCRGSVCSSAREIEEEQHNFGNEGFQVNTSVLY